jgi:uncharacterized protein YdeI (YjbR/CyaY-like superfamily)
MLRLMVAKKTRKQASGRKPAARVAELPVEMFADAAEWMRWLEQHHAAAPGVWMTFAKKGSSLASISYVEAVKEALCWGWIDGQGRALDATRWLVKFTPRGARSVWSKINRERAVALIADQRMRAPGLLEIERAKRDGRWEAAYDSPRTAAVPDDLEAALAEKPRARRFFAAIDAANRYAILWRLQTAKRPETRAKRLALFVAMLERGELIHEKRPAKPRTPSKRKRT